MNRTLAALFVMLVAVPAFADDASTSADSSGFTNPGMRKRYNPGFAIGALTGAQAFEGLNGAASAAGVSLGWAWDLVDVNAQVVQSLAYAGERKPTYFKLNFHYAFATFAPVSVMGLTGLDYVLNGPDRQTTFAPGNLFGPDLGLGIRVRVAPAVDFFVDGAVGLWASRGGPHRMYVEPGVQGGIQFHPFASE